MPFEHKPLGTTNKREIKNYLVTPQDLYINGRYIKGRPCDHYYFRIWKHKHHGWSLYLSDIKKTSHGGLRVKGSGRIPKMKGVKPPTKKQLRRIQEDDFTPIRKQWKKIDSGPHSGKFKNEKGDILSETQLRLVLATRGKGKL